MLKSLQRYFEKLPPRTPSEGLAEAITPKFPVPTSLEGQFEDLDAALRIQNLRRREEEHFERLYWGRGIHKW